MFRYLFFILLSPLLLNSQSDLAIGSWTTHLPYNSGKYITQSKNFIYYATDYAILKINKSDLSFEKITRTEGLNDSRINAIYFHSEQSTLIVAYDNATLDLISENSVRAIVDIVNFNNIPIDKVINKISYKDDQHVFLSSNYGLSLLNVRTGKFIFTLFTPNIKVYDCVVDKNNYFMATEKGMYFLEATGNEIVQSFKSWILLGASYGISPVESFNSCATFNDNIYISNSNEIYQWKNNYFQSVFKSVAYSIKYLSVGTNYLMAGLHCKTNCGELVAFIDKNLNFQTSDASCTEQNLYAIESEDGKIWYADTRWSFRYANSTNELCQAIWVPGPVTNNCFEIASLSDGIYVAAGGVDNVFAPRYWSDGILKYSQKNWSVINSSLPELSQYNLTDILRIAEHPDKTKIYFASAGKGLLEYNRMDQTYKIYNKTNSPLEAPTADTANVRLSGLAFDRNKTLWITNYLASAHGLMSLNSNGDWKKYRFPGNPNLFTEIKIDQNGYKWIVSRQSGGVMVFDEGDPNNPSDDRSIQLNSTNTEMTSNDVRTVEVDLDGDVWVGTAEGPVVFECGASIFDGRCKGSRRKVDQDGIIYFLLSSEVITTIAVDGANRKWFGTSTNGIYVQSPGGELEIHHFNKHNSPLLDNSIFDITIDQKTGDAWIATALGLQVFRSDATHAKDFFTETPLVFPNPVHPDYNGPIAIRGLARDARVKITDLSGRLVHETIANGGQAIWNGSDYLGRKAASGVYLVFANSTQDFETSEAVVTKIIISR